jgi:drug/metabolite transporter (DMT)-like permease
VLLGVVFLHENMTGRTIAGGLCILISVAVVLDIFRVSDSHS